MSAPGDCGCKGSRFCALCESSDRVRNLGRIIRPEEALLSEHYSITLFCCFCKLGYTSKVDMSKLLTINQDELQTIIDVSHKNGHDGDEVVEIDGLLLVTDFISPNEEKGIMDSIDSSPWLPSQSGRRKQDFGPKVNFKHKKVKCDAYKGLPYYADLLLTKMNTHAVLRDYTPFELCNLEYTPERGSCIELHQDDMWIWGERLISINLLSGSIMTLVRQDTKQLVAVSMPRHSLLCMYASVRYDWKHAILSNHIQDRRIALTMREPSKQFKNGDLYEKYGADLIDRSKLRV